MPRRPLLPALGSLLALTLVLTGCGGDEAAAELDPKTAAYCVDAVQFGNALRASRTTVAQERAVVESTADITTRMQDNVPSHLAEDQAVLTATWAKLRDVTKTLPANARLTRAIAQLEAEPVYKDALERVAGWANDTCRDDD